MQSGHRHLSHFLYIEVFKNRQFNLFVVFASFEQGRLVWSLFASSLSLMISCLLASAWARASCPVSPFITICGTPTWEIIIKKYKYNSINSTNHRDYDDYEDDSSGENKRGPPCCCKAIPLSADPPPPQRLRKKSDKWKCWSSVQITSFNASSKVLYLCGDHWHNHWLCYIVAAAIANWKPVGCEVFAGHHLSSTLKASWFTPLTLQYQYHRAVISSSCGNQVRKVRLAGESCPRHLFPRLCQLSPRFTSPTITRGQSTTFPAHWKLI